MGEERKMRIISVLPEHEAFANSYLLIDEETSEAVYIDPGYFLDNAVNAIKNSGARVKYLLLTHGHFDHILGAHAAKEALGAKIAIHPEDEKCLSSRLYSLMDTFGVDAEIFPEKADFYIIDGDVIEFGNSKLKVMHTPGHTPGGVCFISERDRVIFSGDTLFHSTAGRTDCIGGNFEELCASLKKLISLEGNYTVYPGHSIATDLDHERKRNFIIRRMK